MSARVLSLFLPFLLVAAASAYVVPGGFRALQSRNAGARPLRSRPALCLKMGLFDGISQALNNALANEDLGKPVNEGLSADPWLNGMKKCIKIKFVKDGEVVGVADALPGDKLSDVAASAKVTVGDKVMMLANDFKGEVPVAGTKIPVPSRRNAFADSPDDPLMNTGLTAPVFTSYTSRGEVRVETVEVPEYLIQL